MRMHMNINRPSAGLGKHLKMQSAGQTLHVTTTPSNNITAELSFITAICISQYICFSVLITEGVLLLHYIDPCLFQGSH
jgi:hypothetical protein